MNRIFLLLLSFCCLSTTIKGMDRKKRHQQFQSFVQETSKSDGSSYKLGDDFLKKYNVLVVLGAEYINYLVSDVNARKEILKARLKNNKKCVKNKAKRGFTHLGLGTVLCGFGMYNVLENKNLYEGCLTCYLSQGLSWGSIFFGSKYMCSGIKKIYKSMFFSTIINDQIKREEVLQKALRNPNVSDD